MAFWTSIAHKTLLPIYSNFKEATILKGEKMKKQLQTQQHDTLFKCPSLCLPWVLSLVCHAWNSQLPGNMFLIRIMACREKGLKPLLLPFSQCELVPESCYFLQWRNVHIIHQDRCQFFSFGDISRPSVLLMHIPTLPMHISYKPEYPPITSNISGMDIDQKKEESSCLVAWLGR